MIIKVIEVAVVVKEVEVVPSNQEEASKIKNKLYANFLTNQEDAKKPQKIVNFYIYLDRFTELLKNTFISYV